MPRSLQKLLLVDGSSYLYRAFHAMPSLNNSKGEQTGAVYGMTNMLRRLLREYEGHHMAVVFDAPGKTFRDEIYPEYKSNRPPMPDELVTQIEPIHEIVRALGIPLLQVQGVEADDVIGTLAEMARDEGFEVVISTGDKDMAQLVDKKILIENTMDGGTLDAEGVKKKFGVLPSQMVDFLTLVGDSVDNIPGVPKVGPKTAAKWLDAYRTLDAIVANADEIKGKVGENLRASLDRLPLSKKLVTIDRSVELGVEPGDLNISAPDLAALKAWYSRLEFKTWLSELLEEEGKHSVSDEKATEYEVILDQQQFDGWLERLAAAEQFAFDSETTSLDYMSAELVGVSFAVEPKRAAYVPLAHRYEDAPKQLDRAGVLGALKPLLESKTKGKIGQNLKYDMSVLARYGIRLRGVRFDTMLESYVLDSTATRHDMDSLSLKYLSHKPISYEEVAGKGAKQKRFDEVRIEEAGPYAAEDADVALRLHLALWPKLSSEKPLRTLFEEIEIPLIPVLSTMERNGVKVDAGMLAKQSKDLELQMNSIEKEAYSEAGEEFNLGSPKQIQSILFEKLELPVRSKTPKGQPSTAESALMDLAADYPLPRLILEYRAMSKLKSTYTDALPGRINPRTGRVHTSYHQAVASTGRLSSTDPNLQNIPIRTEAGRRVRKAFVAEPGYMLLAADYSQIELRIMAHLSQDQGLIGAFEAGEDIHRATAAEVFGVKDGKVSSEQRRRAKAVNFGLIYGMSAFGLARQLGISRGEAQEYVDTYFARYPGVKSFMDETRERARDRGYVETVFGRRLYLPEIRSRNAQRRQYAERTAINAPMQGTAADIIKRGMVRIHEWLEEERPDARMIMQVHDELVFEVAKDNVEAVRDEVVGHMSAAAKLSVPLVVEAGAGSDWEEAH
jgi:DNA polymerase-1